MVFFFPCLFVLQGNEPSSPGLLRSLYGARESINTAFTSPSAVEVGQIRVYAPFR